LDQAAARQILGVRPDADPQEIVAKYRSLVQCANAEAHKQNGNAERLIDLSVAYSILSFSTSALLYRNWVGLWMNGVWVYEEFIGPR